MPTANGLDDFANLEVDPTVSIITAFNRLAIQKDWKKNSAVYKDQRARLLVDEFSAQFGNNLSNLGGWQAMCRAVDIAIPSSINQCKKVSFEGTVYMQLVSWSNRGPASQKCPCQYLRSHRCSPYRQTRPHIRQQRRTCKVHEEERQSVSKVGCEAEQPVEVHVEASQLMAGKLASQTSAASMVQCLAAPNFMSTRRLGLCLAMKIVEAC